MPQLRIDVITIFPRYFDVLELSLMGRAQESGALDVRVHDLRDFAHDRHRTVDDTPYGGGPGMLMRPEPWGEALDHVRATDAGDLSKAGDPSKAGDLSDERPLLLVPSPAGAPFTQADAQAWAQEPWLVVACGRYEGIDARVATAADAQYRVREVSLGDYVLNGGEVAALAMIEAVGRLLPGVVGNVDSLADESHATGTLEAPAYTKPAAWRGLEVPEVLMSGHHGQIASWRRETSWRRTSTVRPDLIAALDPAGLEPVDLAVLEQLGWQVHDGRFRLVGPGMAD